MKQRVALLLVMMTFISVLPLRAQSTCDAPPPRLQADGHGDVISGKGPVNAYVEADPTSQKAGVVTDAEPWFQVQAGPECINGVNWWQVNTMSFGSVWLAETVNGAYVVEPFVFVPAAPVALKE